jgi:hypothetical protein
LLIVADATDNVTEMYEDNNTNCLSIYVTGDQTVDLYPSNPNLSPSTVPAGESVETDVWEVIHVTSNNNNKKKSLVYMYYYLSEDTVWDINDEFIGETFTVMYDTDTMVQIQNEIEIPSNTPSGNYYMLFVVDPTNLIFETNENNNMKYAPITVLPASVQDVNKDEIKLYPNPARMELNVSGDVRFTRIDIVSLNGAMIRSMKNVNAGKVVIDISGLADGVYYLIATDVNGKIFIRKFVKAE